MNNISTMKLLVKILIKSQYIVYDLLNFFNLLYILLCVTQMKNLQNLIII